MSRVAAPPGLSAPQTSSGGSAPVLASPPLTAPSFQAPDAFTGANPLGLHGHSDAWKSQLGVLGMTESVASDPFAFHAGLLSSPLQTGLLSPLPSLFSSAPTQPQGLSAPYQQGMQLPSGLQMPMGMQMPFQGLPSLLPPAFHSSLGVPFPSMHQQGLPMGSLLSGMQFGVEPQDSTAAALHSSQELSASLLSSAPFSSVPFGSPTNRTPMNVPGMQHAMGMLSAAALQTIQPNGAPVAPPSSSALLSHHNEAAIRSPGKGIQESTIDPWLADLSTLGASKIRSIDCPDTCVVERIAAQVEKASPIDLPATKALLAAADAKARTGCTRGDSCPFRHCRLALFTANAIRQQDSENIIFGSIAATTWQNALDTFLARQSLVVCPLWRQSEGLACTNELCPFLHPHPCIMHASDCSEYLCAAASGDNKVDHPTGCTLRHSWSLQTALTQRHVVRVCAEWCNPSSRKASTDRLKEAQHALKGKQRNHSPGSTSLLTLDIDLVSLAANTRLETEINSARAAVFGCSKGIDCPHLHPRDPAAPLTSYDVNILPFLHSEDLKTYRASLHTSSSMLLEHAGLSYHFAPQAVDRFVQEYKAAVDGSTSAHAASSSGTALDEEQFLRLALGDDDPMMASLESEEVATHAVESKKPAARTKADIVPVPDFPKPTPVARTVSAPNPTSAHAHAHAHPTGGTSTALPAAAGNAKTLLVRALVPEGLGIDGTLSIGTTTNVIMAASNILAKRLGKGRCPDWFVMKKFCPRGDSCSMFHLRLCPDDKPAMGGGQCAKNKVGKCEFWHFRPVHLCRAFLVKREPRDCKYGNSCTYLHVSPAALNLPELSQEAPIPPSVTTDARKYIQAYDPEVHGIPMPAAPAPAPPVPQPPLPAVPRSANAAAAIAAPQNNKAAVVSTAAAAVVSKPAVPAVAPVAATKSAPAAPAPAASTTATNSKKPVVVQILKKPAATVRTGAVPPPSAATGPVTGFTWQCPVCTFAENDVLDDVCQVCECRKS